MRRCCVCTAFVLVAQLCATITIMIIVINKVVWRSVALGLHARTACLIYPFRCNYIGQGRVGRGSDVPRGSVLCGWLPLANPPSTEPSRNGARWEEWIPKDSISASAVPVRSCQNIRRHLSMVAETVINHQRSHPPSIEIMPVPEVAHSSGTCTTRRFRLSLENEEVGKQVGQQARYGVCILLFRRYLLFLGLQPTVQPTKREARETHRRAHCAETMTRVSGV